MRTALFVAIVALSACKKGDGAPSCEQVVDKMIALTKTSASKASLVSECHARNVTPTQRTCMVAAKDLGELAGCVGKKRMTRSEDSPPPIPDQPDPHAGLKQELFAPSDPHNLPLTPNKIENGSAGSGSASTP